MRNHDYIFALLADEIDGIFRISSQAGMWSYNRTLYGFVQPNTHNKTSQFTTNYKTDSEKGRKASMNFTGYCISEECQRYDIPELENKKWNPLFSPKNIPSWCQGLNYKSINDLGNYLGTWFLNWFNVIYRVDHLLKIKIVIESNSQHQIDLSEEFIKKAIADKIPVTIQKHLDQSGAYSNKLADDVLANIKKYA